MKLYGTVIVGMCSGNPETRNRPPSPIGQLSAQAEGSEGAQNSPRSARQSQITRPCRKGKEPTRSGEDGQSDSRRFGEDFRCWSNGGAQIEAIGAKVGLGDAAIGKVRQTQGDDNFGARGDGDGPAQAEADGGIER